jgi:hypothetical protein
MYLRVLVLMLALAIAARAEDAKSALERFAKYRQLATAIRPNSTKPEVLALLGPPESKGPGGWNDLDREIWFYQDYADDERSLILDVIFKPGSPTAVSAVQTLRGDLVKLPVKREQGIVQSIYPAYLTPAGFFCQVLMSDGTQATVGVANRTRVTGEPAVGSRIRFAHRDAPAMFNFVGQSSLYLESIEFTIGK